MSKFLGCLALTVALGAPGAAKAADKPNVIVILVDTLRADRLGTYGSDRAGVTPNLDQLASEGVVFENAISVAYWTIPSVASLFTGVYPTVHGVLANEQDPEKRATFQPVFAERHTTLAEVFQTDGYDTKAILKPCHLHADLGYGEGFDSYGCVKSPTMSYGDSGQRVTDAAISWLDERGDQEDPFFLYLHYNDPHDPYQPPAPYSGKWEPPGYTGGLTGSREDMVKLADRALPNPGQHAEFLLSRYDESTHYWDSQLGRLLARLEQDGLAENTVIAVTSDHGEQFFEHEYWLHKNVYIENIHVPLVIRAPGVTPSRVGGWVEHFDLAPTVVSLAGLTAPTAWQATDLTPSMKTGQTDGSTVYCYHGQFATAIDAGGTAVISHLKPHDDEWVLHRNHDSGAPMVFDMNRDPGQQTDLYSERQADGDRLAASIQTWLKANEVLAEQVKATKRELDDEEIELLRAMGYLE